VGFRAGRPGLDADPDSSDAPQVFIDDSQFKDLWLAPERYYLLTFQRDLPRYEQLVGAPCLLTIAASGGKVLLTNQPTGAAEHSAPPEPESN